MSSERIKVLLVEDNLGDARLLYEGLEEALPGQFQGRDPKAWQVVAALTRQNYFFPI